MKFFKNLKFDIVQGILKRPLVFILPLFIAVGTFIDCFNKVKGFQSIPELNIGRANVGDFLVYVYGGMREHVVGDIDFQIPIIWIMVLITILFLVLSYPTTEMTGYGLQYIVHSGGRAKWWMSKCIWNILITLVYHFVLIVGTVCLCMANGMSFSLKVNSDIVAGLFAYSLTGELKECQYVPLYIIFLPVCVSIALNMLEMFMTLFIRTIYSFLFMCVVLVVSAFFLSQFVIGNYAMIVRYNWINYNGVSCLTGYVISAIIILFVFIAGTIRFKNYDIINRD